MHATHQVLSSSWKQDSDCGKSLKFDKLKLSKVAGVCTLGVNILRIGLPKFGHHRE